MRIPKKNEIVILHIEINLIVISVTVFTLFSPSGPHLHKKGGYQEALKYSIPLCAINAAEMLLSICFDWRVPCHVMTAKI
jgi:hypothetical protein